MFTFFALRYQERAYVEDGGAFEATLEAFNVSHKGNVFVQVHWRLLPKRVHSRVPRMDRHRPCVLQAL